MNKPNPKHKGEVSEAFILAELIKRNIKVLKPYGDNLRYDLAIESTKNNKFLKIQCKTGKIIKNKNTNSLSFRTCSVRINANGYFIKGYKEDVDLFAVYSPELNKVYILNVNECADTNQKLMLEP